MHEILTLINEQARNAWRFRWYAILAAWIIAVVGWLLVYSLPDKYESSARVHIDTQSLLSPLLAGLSVEPDLASQVQLVTRTVLSRPHLKQVVRKTDLNLRVHSPDEENTMLTKLQHNIQITGARKLNLYSITYTNSDPAMAQSVVQQVLNILMSQSMSNTVASSSNATGFLQKQLKKYGSMLDDAQKKLADFKKTHLGSLPGQGGYFNRYTRTKNQIHQLRQRLSRNQQKQKAREKQINGMKNGKSPIAASQSPKVKSINAQIQQDSATLSQMLLKYTPQYPDVITLKQTIARLKKRRKQTIEELKHQGANTFSAADPVYQKAQIQLNSLQSRASAIQTRIAQKSADLAKFKNDVDQKTDVSAQLKSLTRNYNVTKGRYTQLLNRLYSAQLSETQQNSSSKLKFRVIDPPNAPIAPVGPPRALFMVAVLVIALVIGAAFAFFLSQIRPVFMNRTRLAEVTGYPVLGAVSLAQTARHRYLERSRLVMFGSAVGALVVAYIIAASLAGVGTHFVRGLVGS